MKNSNKITKLGDHYEIKSFLFTKKVVNRLLDGFFHFKKRKGEIVAGGATFFALLSFTPIILMIVSLTGFFMGDVSLAKEHVLDTIRVNFPQMAPWILDSVEKIVSSQLKNSAGFNALNTFVLLYASLGVVSSSIFGINTIAKKESKGGFFLEDVKSILTGLFVSSFILGLLMLSNKSYISQNFQSDYLWVNSFVEIMVSNSVLPALASLAFFTLFYQFAIPRKTNWKDSLLGASAFVGCFMAGKSFYWIYLLYSKDGLTQSFGNFYTMFISVFWVYFLMCSFFYGASVASVKSEDVYGAEESAPSGNLEVISKEDSVAEKVEEDSAA